MTVDKLIEKLQKLKEKGKGNYPVYYLSNNYIRELAAIYDVEHIIDENSCITLY